MLHTGPAKKTYIAVYLDVGSLTPSDVPGYVKRAKEVLHPGDDDVTMFVIPTRESSTKIEILNPPVVIADSNAKVFAQKYLEKLDDVLNVLKRNGIENL